MAATNKLRVELTLAAVFPTGVASAPISFVFAQEGHEHEIITGLVKKVDDSAGNITLQHGPIKSPGMDEGMTMVFAVQDTS
jgi:Cu(I)/Ag(I) efflux system periplasmic protein CusF